MAVKSSIILEKPKKNNFSEPYIFWFHISNRKINYTEVVVIPKFVRKRGIFPRNKFKFD